MDLIHDPQAPAAHSDVAPLEAQSPGDPATRSLQVELEAMKLALQLESAKRRQAEMALEQRDQELADFVENAVEGLHKVDGQGMILWANRAELAMLGYEPHEYVGRSITEFHVDADVISDILQRLLRGEAIYDYRARLRCKDGSVKQVSIHSNGCFADGGLKYTRCYTRDATVSHERDQLMQALSRAGQAKDEFLAMLGHELRNPLAPIVTALSLMRMRGGTQTLHEQGIIERQTNHLVRLVDDLLDVSRITSGKIDLRIEEVDLSKVLAKAVEMANLHLEQRQHRLTLDVAAGLTWTGDPARLAQIVSNLLTNAARYTEVGGQIQLRAWPSSEDTLAISVRDNGVGIAPDQIDRLFELFFQVQQSIDRPEGGLGIGLSLVKRLVELHGGTVRVRSDGLGRGSEFTVELPIRASVAGPAIDHAASRGAAQRFAEGACQGRRIAVVDDNVDNADLLGELIASEGFEVEVFYDPTRALSRFAEWAPEVAILDIGLPVMDGYELAREIRRLPSGAACKLVALSGYGQAEARARSTASGFHAHWVKPAEPMEVMAQVRQLLGMKPLA